MYLEFESMAGSVHLKSQKESRSQPCLSQKGEKRKIMKIDKVQESRSQESRSDNRKQRILERRCWETIPETGDLGDQKLAYRWLLQNRTIDGALRQVRREVAPLEKPKRIPEPTLFGPR